MGHKYKKMCKGHYFGDSIYKGSRDICKKPFLQKNVNNFVIRVIMKFVLIFYFYMLYPLIFFTQKNPVQGLNQKMCVVMFVNKLFFNM